MDLKGIKNHNEYFTNFYLTSHFSEEVNSAFLSMDENEKASSAKNSFNKALQDFVKEYNNRYFGKADIRNLRIIKELGDEYLEALGYLEANSTNVLVDDLEIPVYHKFDNLWVLLSSVNKESEDTNESDICDILHASIFDFNKLEDDDASYADLTRPFENIKNESLITKIFFSEDDTPPRFILLVGLNSIALLDRNKWSEKRFIELNFEDVRQSHSSDIIKAIIVLFHKDNLCPEEQEPVIDTLSDSSRRNALGVSQDLKYALRECIELIGNEVLYDLSHNKGRDLEKDPVDAGELSIQSLRYMYRMLFMLFIEARPELGFCPIKADTYFKGYSLEALREIAEKTHLETSNVGDGYFFHESLTKLYDLIYNGYQKKDKTKRTDEESLSYVFEIPALKGHLFDPERTSLITNAKIRNSVMIRIIQLMSSAKYGTGKNARRSRISYANLGINQLGAVYEALLSYRGFIANETLYEVKSVSEKDDKKTEKSSQDELAVGYFVTEKELGEYSEKERVRYKDGEKKGKLKEYPKGTFIYRLAGREKEKSASYYTPECLTQCLVKYALKELLEGKDADEILNLTILEPAMGSAAFLNEAINQIAESYINKKQKELKESIPHEKRFTELQKVKMYIADHNVYGIDLNSTAVELAEVSLWLNTIYEGGYVPWFRTQLVNGNSLVGARREVYSVFDLSNGKKSKWYETSPKRVAFDKKRGEDKIYHFLLGDKGMANYTDKVIKSLEPEKIKALVEWNKEFNKDYSEDDIENLKNLSNAIDKLWKEQIELRNRVESSTQDEFPVYGQKDNGYFVKTTIREKDEIYDQQYLSKNMQNSGPYARLKFAMDYWCALWFWPIDKAELLPTRDEFIFDMYNILLGSYYGSTASKYDKSSQAGFDFIDDGKSKDALNTQERQGEFDFFIDNENNLSKEALARQSIDELQKTYEETGYKVNIDFLCETQPRLSLIRKIANRNKFFHWELEFADVFDKKGGFDLVIGNPPWLKLGWNEQNVLSDTNPLFVIKKLSASETSKERKKALEDNKTRENYFSEYEEISATQNFLNAMQNYEVLKGQKANLYKCFLPQAWKFNTKDGVSSFIHQEGVFDDADGQDLRKALYSKLKKHFQFINEKLLFQDVGHPETFSLNVYTNKKHDSFDTIANLFDPRTIDESYESNKIGKIPSLKDENGNWNIKGHPHRVIKVGEDELKLFSKVFDNGKDFKGAKLPRLHVREFIFILECFGYAIQTVKDFKDDIFISQMLNETKSQKDGIIKRDVHFARAPIDLIYSGSHIFGQNPLFKTSRRICNLKGDFDNIDLTKINEGYLPRSNYSISCSLKEYEEKLPTTPWGEKYHNLYRIASRLMLNIKQARTLSTAIIPPKTGHINGIIGIALKNKVNLLLLGGYFSSLPFDFFLKITGKGNLYPDTISSFPFQNTRYVKPIISRVLLLCSLNKYYKELWDEIKCDENDSWSKEDKRLDNSFFKNINVPWNWSSPLRTDYARRQALVEIDVLTSMAFGMSLKELILAYQIQFPVLQDYEANTWYDQNGRIVYTKNMSLTNVGYSSSEKKIWESIKDTKTREEFVREIEDDTMPNGPIKRKITYVAPFDVCDRIKDYETAWEFFSKKYNNE